MAEQAGEKTEAPTPRRRQEARKQGTVAKSTDLTGALALLACAFILPSLASNLGSGVIHSLRLGVGAPPDSVTFSEVMRYAQVVSLPALAAIAPLFLVVMAVGLTSNFAQVGFVLSGEAMKPKLEKLNPAQGFKRLFSMRSTFEGLKALAKMLLFGGIAYAVIRSKWPEIVGLSALTPPQAAAACGQIMHTILVRIAGVWLVIALADYLFQRQQVEKQLKMTKDELRKEMKEMEGSPEIKMAQAQRRRKLQKGAMAQRIRKADVLITNPTHFAIAIQYERNKMHAPMVLAKGQDYLALKMREIAEDNQVPIVENKPLARALYKQCEAGDYVPRDLFGPVAEVLAYVYRTFQRVRKQAS